MISAANEYWRLGPVLPSYRWYQPAVNQTFIHHFFVSYRIDPMIIMILVFRVVFEHISQRFSAVQPGKGHPMASWRTQAARHMAAVLSIRGWFGKLVSSFSRIKACVILSGLLNWTDLNWLRLEKRGECADGSSPWLRQRCCGVQCVRRWRWN